MELDKEIQLGSEADIYQPLIAYICAKKMGESLPFSVPKQSPQALHKLAKLALLYKEAGFVMEASKLAKTILNLRSFPTLWCKEKEFDLQSIEEQIKAVEGLVVDNSKMDLDVQLLQNEQMEAALTYTGEATGLGAFRCGSVEVTAFGPQNGALQFGIHGAGVDGWVQSLVQPEVWVHMKPEYIKKGIKLKLHFVGHRPEEPLFMAFYVKASSCTVGSQEFLPKSLNRFRNQAQFVQFDNQFFIEAFKPLNTQVIPLAGKGCYWDSTFLILFEISPFISQLYLNLYYC